MALFSKSRSRQPDVDGRSELHPGLIDLVGQAHLELIPTPKVDEQFPLLLPASTISVTCSPAKGIQPTLDTAARLLDLGHTVVPHLAARMVESPQHAIRIAEWLSTHDVRDVFVIGGDAPAPHGPFPDAVSLVRALLDAGAGLGRIGFGAYPDGHPMIDHDALAAALAAKQQLLADADVSGWISTQMCFDTTTITEWIAARRGDGIDLPIHLGIPGVIDTAKLLTMGMRLGIGASLRYLRKNRSMVSTLAAGRYDPLDLLVPMANDLDALGIEALHVFTFNQVANTVAWQTGITEEVAHELSV